MKPMISVSDQLQLRRQFWLGKAIDGLRSAMRDAQRRGDPLEFYRLRDELEDIAISANSPVSRNW